MAPYRVIKVKRECETEMVMGEAHTIRFVYAWCRRWSLSTSAATWACWAQSVVQVKCSAKGKDGAECVQGSDANG